MTNEDIISNLQVLINTPAWTFFKEFIRKNDIALDKEKLEEAERNPSESIQEIRRLRNKIDMMEDLLEMPETIIERSGTSETIRDKDPYCQNETEIKQLSDQ